MSEQPEEEPVQPDAYLAASAVDQFMTQRNPFQVLVGDMAQNFQAMVNFRKTRELARLKLTDMQQKLAKIEGQIASGNEKTTGTRFDKLR